MTQIQTVQMFDEDTKLGVVFREWDFVAEAWTPVDIGPATTVDIKLEAPSGATVTRTATLETDGSDGRAYILSLPGELNEYDIWKKQGYVEVGGKWHTTIGEFKVEYNLG